ncbi:MAG: hypothetical protein AAF125_27830, partial [Chloroflexota bacterium]
MSDAQQTAPQGEPEVRNALLDSQRTQTFGEYIDSYVRRVRAGDLGILPIVFGLIVIAIFFQDRNSNFLTPQNLSNLIIQMAAICTIGYGVVFVLLIGEIDLSVSYISAMAGAILVITMLPDRGFPIGFQYNDQVFVNGREYVIANDPVIADGFTIEVGGETVEATSIAFIRDGNPIVIDGVAPEVDGEPVVADGLTIVADGEILDVDEEA